MKPSTRKILKQVVAYITTHKDGAELYHIITALRGPDSSDHTLKSCATSVLRNAIGLSGYHEGNNLNYDSYPDDDERAARRKKMFAELFALYDRSHTTFSEAEKKLYAEGHCISHLKMGFESAGLDVGKNNTAIRKAKATAKHKAIRRAKARR